MAVETRGSRDVPSRGSEWEEMLNRHGRYTVLVSRNSVRSLESYIANRKQILEKMGKTEGEIDIMNSMGNQIQTSVTRDKRGGPRIALSLKTDDVGALGHDIIARQIRFPPLLRAVSEIVRGKDEFSDIGQYCQSVLDEIANMPGNPSLVGSLKRVFFGGKGRKA